MFINHLRDIAQASGGALWGGADVEVTGVAIDSRTVKPGDLFVAIAGERVDGHQFIAAAIQAGAVAVMASNAAYVPEGFPAVLIGDTVWALGNLAKCCRMAWQVHRYSVDGNPNVPLVGVTGSVGKSTTREMIAAVLSADYNVMRTPRNYNTEIGLPLTLVTLSEQHTAAVLEMGMRGRGQIDLLADVAQPNIGVITNIGDAHQELLGSRDEIMLAKSELLNRLPDDGVAILNADDPYYPQLRELVPCRVISFGCSDWAGLRAKNIKAFVDGHVEFTLRSGQRDLPVSIPLAGTHNVMNALAALAVAQATGIELEVGIEMLKKVQPLDMRMNVKTLQNSVTILDDTYNANPTSTRAALDTLVSMSDTARKVVVLGDMLELGESSGNLHREIGRNVGQAGAHLFIAVGSRARDMVAGAKEQERPPLCMCYTSSSSAAAHINEWIMPGDIVLVKGSRGIHMEAIVEAI